jgi:hypothetical protein
MHCVAQESDPYQVVRSGELLLRRRHVGHAEIEEIGDGVELALHNGERDESAKRDAPNLVGRAGREVASDAGIAERI